MRDVIAHALSAELKLDIAETKRRNHATHLARGAAHEGYDLVVCFGGDGTLNEVINGLSESDIPLVPIPGGGTNVFARTLGLPKDPIEATSIVLEKLSSGEQPRRINLGRINGRMFAFCAGVGFDATVVQAVERGVRLRKRFGEVSFIAQAVRKALAQQGRRAKIRVTAEGRTIERAHVAIACNSRPYTFLGDRMFDLVPTAELEKGLDAIVVTTLNIPAILRIVYGAFWAHKIKHPKATIFHDLDGLYIEADERMPYQVDGDYAGEGSSFRFESVPNALAVIA
jgi:diacylglycerol kinase family enzyme